MTIHLENPYGSEALDRVARVLDAVRALPDRPAPAPSPELATFLKHAGPRPGAAAGGPQIEILDSGDELADPAGDELAARRNRRGLFAAKVAVAAVCLTATGVAAAGAVTGVGPVPRLPVLERRAPAKQETPKAPADKVSRPASQESTTRVTVVAPGGSPAGSTTTTTPGPDTSTDEGTSADDGLGFQARHRRHRNGAGADHGARFVEFGKRYGWWVDPPSERSKGSDRHGAATKVSGRNDHQNDHRSDHRSGDRADGSRDRRGGDGDAGEHEHGRDGGHRGDRGGGRSHRGGSD